MRYCPSSLETGLNGTKPGGSPTSYSGRFTMSVAWRAKTGKPRVQERRPSRGASNRFVEADPAHAVEASYWDADPWKLGTPGGTVDLEAGGVLEADPAHRITQLTAVAPELPSAGQVQRLPALASIPGRMYRERYPTCQFFTTMVWLLSDGFRPRACAGVSSMGRAALAKVSFLKCPIRRPGRLCNDGGHGRADREQVLTEHPTEIASLSGARLVTASETDEGRSWSEARVKTLTGGDRLSARFMRQRLFPVRPHVQADAVW